MRRAASGFKPSLVARILLFQLFQKKLQAFRNRLRFTFSFWVKRASTQMAKRVIDRRVRKVVGGHDFHVPAPEERIVISALQRVYRHFYFQLCDMIDMTLLMQSEPLDFAELRNAAEVAGIWPGVATFLGLIQSYIKSYGGDVPLPAEVIEAAHSRGDGVRFGNGFLRVSKPTGAGLYGSQLVHAGRHRDVRALLRLPPLPPLAISALVAHSLTGNDKGIW